MKTCDKAKYQWAVIGAGPAGLASVGILLEQGVCAKDILMIDPHFHVGDFRGVPHERIAHLRRKCREHIVPVDGCRRRKYKRGVHPAKQRLAFAGE